MYLDLAIVAGALAIFYLNGWGLTRLLLGEEHRAWVWCLAPWSGISVTILVSTLLGLFNIGTKYSGPTCLLLGLGLLYASQRKLPPCLAWAHIKAHKKFLIPSAALLFAGLVPVAWLSDFPTTVAYGNLDPATYALVADYLRDQGLDAPPADSTIPYLSQPGVIMWMPRWGAFLLLSSVNSILGLEGYQSFNLILAAIAGCLPLALCFFSKVVFEQSGRISLLATLFLALNVNTLWVLYHGFLAQVIALGLLIIGLTLGVRTLEQGISKPTLLGAILSSALVGSYPEILPFLIGPLVLYSGLLSASNHGLRWRPIFRLGLFGLLVVAVFPIYATNAVRILHIQSVTRPRPGWDLPRYASLPEALGVWNVHLLPRLNVGLLLLLTAVLLLLLFRGILLSKRKRFWLALVASYLPILLYFRLLSPYSYGYYKATTYCLFAAVTLLAASLQLPGEGWQKALARVGAWGLLSMIMFGSFGLAKDHVRSHHKFVDENLVQLGQLGFRETGVYLCEDSWWDQLWVVYFLGSRSVALSAENGYLSVSSSMARDQSRPDELVIAPVRGEDIFQIKLPSGGIYLKNTKYTVGKFSPQFCPIPVLETGWWGIENSASGNRFRWMSQDASFRIDATEEVEQNMRMEAVSYQKARQLQVFVNDALIDEHTVSSESVTVVETKSFTLRAGQNRIRFHVNEGPLMPPGGKDPRHLSVSFGSIEFSTVSPP